jgi:hypothetical protein
MRKLARFLPFFAFFGGMAVLRADTPPPPTAAPAPALSSADMLKRSGEIRVQLDADKKKILFLKEQTRKLKDVIKLSCVNDKLVQVNAEMNIADSTNDQLQTAISKNSDDRIGLFNQLTEIGSTVKRLREEAAACVGEGELYKQEAGITVDHPEIIDDPTAYQFAGEMEPPGYASPFH